MDPNYPIAHTYLCRAYIQNSNFKGAVGECRTAARLSENHPFHTAWLGYAFAKAGDRDEALRIVRELQAKSRRTYVAPHDIAAIFVGLGRKSEAFAWLSKACDERSYFVLEAAVEPEFDLLRADPRYRDLLRRLNLTADIAFRSR